MTPKQIQKELNGTVTIPPLQDPTLIEIFTRLGLEGYTLEHEGITILATNQEWCVLYSKRSRSFQAYYKGYGHCAITCPLQDFRDADHIYLWIEEQKLVELTERPVDTDPENNSVHASGAKDRKWLTQEQIQEIVKLVREGHTKAEVSRMFGVSNPTVTYYCKKFL
jgi:hypothetical protein